MFYKPQGSLNVNVVELFGNFTIGSSGAVSASSAKGFSVAKTGSETGRYTITLVDQYNYFLGAQVTVALAADAAAGSDGFIPSVRNVDMASKTFDIQISDAAGADTNPASGFVIYVAVKLQNSAVNR